MGSRFKFRRVFGARTGLLLTLIGFSVVAVPICAQIPQRSPSTLEHDFQAAMAAQDKGDLERAKFLLLKLRREHPGIFAVDESLGLIYAAQQKFDEALPLLQAAVHDQPSSDAAHTNLGAAFFKLHRNGEALDEFTRAVRLNPRNTAAQQGLGEYWMDAGKPERAVESFKAALQEKPNDLALELDCATAMVAARRFNEAQEALNKLPEADASADAQILLGQIDEAKGNFDQAVRHFNHAVELDPSEANVWALGVEFLRHWTFDAAIREFQAATVKFPASTRMKLGLGAAYFGGTKYNEAIPVFADLLEADKNNALYAEFLGKTCTVVADLAKQRCGVLVTYAETHPHNATADTYVATMLMTEAADDSKTDLARRMLTNALAENPKLPEAQYQIGLLKQRQGDWPGSISNLETAVRLKPEMTQAHYRLALAYGRVGRKQEAGAEMALQRQYVQQEQQDLDRRSQQIMAFVVNMQN